MIEGLSDEPREVSHGTSMMLGSYILTLRTHAAHGKVQILLTKGRTLVAESWHDIDSIRRVVEPHIRSI